MVLQKRKAIVSSSAPFGIAKRPAAASEDSVKADEMPQGEEVPELPMDEEEHEEGEEAEEEEEEEVSEEDKLAKEEEDATSSRKKELKAMYIDELKQLVTSKGLEHAKKEDMINSVLAEEAKERAQKRAHQAKLRAVVVSKQEELQSMPLPALVELCKSHGIKGVMQKQARIELMMKAWQEDDGVDKALAKMAIEEREKELCSMDKAALRRLCEAAGVNPFVRQVMAERLVRQEQALGKFAKPTLDEQPKEPETQQKPAKKGAKASMVDSFLESEARRKEQLAETKRQQELEASKRKELKAKSNEELKKLLVKKGREATGKKDDMVEELFQLSVQEEALEAKRHQLRALAPEELKGVVSARGLATGKKEDMVQALIEHEAKVVKAVEEHAAKVEEALQKRRQELDEKTAQELKDMCASRELPVGTAKNERVDRLIDHARNNCEMDQVIAAQARAARTEEVLALEHEKILKLCEDAEVDPLVKDVMVERILAHEAEFGRISEPRSEEPAAKKQRRK